MTILDVRDVRKLNSVWQAFKESWAQPWPKKLKHLKYRLLWEIRPWLKRPGVAPLAIDIEAASLCNFKCIFCQQSTEWWKKDKPIPMIDWQTFKKVVDESAKIGVYSMKVNWRGEPTLNPHLPAMIRYMKAAGIHEVMMNTNASLLTVTYADAIIQAGIDRVIFSCDGLSKETYNTLRRGGAFDVFMANVKMFRQRCFANKALGYKIPVIRINAAVMEENKHEIPEFARVFKDLADELRFNTLYNPQQSNKLLGGRLRKEKRRGCPQIYQRMIVSTEGDAVPCCADYLKKLKLGNVNKESLMGMYRGGQEAIRILHETNEGRSLPGCDKCDLFALSETNKEGEVIWR